MEQMYELFLLIDVMAMPIVIGMIAKYYYDDFKGRIKEPFDK
jgi:hypothetical protein